MNELAKFKSAGEGLFSLNSLQQKLFEARQEKSLFLQNGDTGYASAPSNIALLKYWGKRSGAPQIPVNSSVSYTLGGFRSFTKVVVRGRFFPEAQPKPTSETFEHRIALNGTALAPLESKMGRFVNSLLAPFASEIALEIYSENNFPTACGIASSASGYAALVGAVADLLQLKKHFTSAELEYWLTQWARLGSGSAARSALENAKSQYVCWEVSSNEHSTQTYSLLPAAQLKQLGHAVVVLENTPKAVSSSAGHGHAHTSVLQSIRVAGVPRKFAQMQKAVEQNEFLVLSALAEEDAFAMHAVMQTSQHPACYLTAATAHLIEEFVKWRNANNVSAFWTLDAGPNLHLLWLPSAQMQIENFIESVSKTDNGVRQVLWNLSEQGMQLGKAPYFELLRSDSLLKSENVSSAGGGK